MLRDKLNENVARITWPLVFRDGSEPILSAKTTKATIVDVKE